MLNFKRAKKFIAISICSLIGLAPMLQATTAYSASTTGISSASDSAYNWLKYQQDSAKLQSSGELSGLVDSFEDFSGPNQPITEVYTYDQAVAAIAFLVKGDVPRAKKVLTIMQKLQATDGSWVNSYYYNNLAGGELRKHVGPVMWMALAVANYEKITGDTATYRDMAIKAIDWCLQFQQANGGIAGGVNYWDNPGSWTKEVWSSTEQNQDSYAALKYFATAAPQKANVYIAAATKVKSFLDNVVWDSSNNRFKGGFKNNTGLIDPAIPLDVNPWGVLALGLNGTRNYSSSLDYVENAAGDPSTHAGTWANPKYVHTLTDESTGKQITGYDFDWLSDHSAGDPSWGGGYHDADIWFEGTAFMACAYYMKGDTAKADSILNEMIKKQATNDAYCNGGIPYSLKGSQNSYWKMSQQNCVSSTGWFVIAAAKWNPFTASSLSSNPPTTQVAMPAFSLAGGTYTSAQQVSISCFTQGATIRYTTDGTEPTEASKVYSAPITVSTTTTIKACAFKAGMTKSSTSSAQYIIGSTPTNNNVIGDFNVKFSYDGKNLTVTLIPQKSTATTNNLWYTEIQNPTKLSQARDGYAVGNKNAEGNYVVVIPNAVIGSNGLINLCLAKNGGDTGWVAFNINSSPGTTKFIGEFSVKFSYDNKNLTVTLIPQNSSATTTNLWYTEMQNPTQLSQARAGYAIGNKNAAGNYVVTIPNAVIGANGLINIYLATNKGDKGWVAFNIYGN